MWTKSACELVLLYNLDFSTFVFSCAHTYKLTCIPMANHTPVLHVNLITGQNGKHGSMQMTDISEKWHLRMNGMVLIKIGQYIWMTHVWHTWNYGCTFKLAKNKKMKWWQRRLSVQNHVGCLTQSDLVAVLDGWEVCLIIWSCHIFWDFFLLPLWNSVKGGTFSY